MNNQTPEPPKSPKESWDRFKKSIRGSRVRTKHRSKILTLNRFLWMFIVIGISVASSQYFQIQGIASVLAVGTVLILCLIVGYLRLMTLNNVEEYMNIIRSQAEDFNHMHDDYRVQLQSTKYYIYLVLATGAMLMAYTTYGPEFPFDLSAWIVGLTVYNVFECYQKIRSMIEEHSDRADYVLHNMNKNGN